MHVYDEKCSALTVVISTSFTVNYIGMSKFVGIGSTQTTILKILIQC